MERTVEDKDKGSSGSHLGETQVTVSSDLLSGYSSESSSDSESDSEDEDNEKSGFDRLNPDQTSAKELTLVDDESPLLHQGIEGEGQGEGDIGDEDVGEDDEEYADYESSVRLDPVAFRCTPGPNDEMDGEASITESTSRAASSKQEESLGDKLKKKKKRRKKVWYICLTNCKYEVVRKMSRRFGFKEVSDDEDWIMYWTDYSVALERVMDMKRYQKINHFPGMSEICRKDLLARNLNRMGKLFPKDYNIFPKTWCLPADYGDLQSYTRQKKNKTYILKPESGCQGRGIWLTKSPKEIKANEHMICQQYLNKPFLIDGFKFDFRVYTLVTSCDPLRVFVFKDGLGRFATCSYADPTHNNTENVYMHLTNYAINKHSEDFVRDDEAGSKRRITTINKYLREKGYDVDKLWADVDDVIIKTLISSHSVLRHNYRTCFPNHVKGSACFEILGFDIILDKKLKPFVLEVIAENMEYHKALGAILVHYGSHHQACIMVNHSPSFTTDSSLDREIKGMLIWDTLHLVNFGACDKRRCIEEDKRKIKERLFQKQNKKESKADMEQAQSQYQQYLQRYEDNHLGNFRRIYPTANSDKYERFFHSSGSLFQETAAFRARAEIARQQREEIARKHEKLEVMLKGKKGNALRPESPTSRRRRIKRPSLPSRKCIASSNSDHSLTDLTDMSLGDETVDTSKPMDIIEEEELERISGLLQRENLVRGLGVKEHVYRLLHCTPGTMGVMKAESKSIQQTLNDQQQASQDPYLYQHSHYQHVSYSTSSATNHTLSNRHKHGNITQNALFGHSASHTHQQQQASRGSAAMAMTHGVSGGHVGHPSQWSRSRSSAPGIRQPQGAVQGLSVTAVQRNRIVRKPLGATKGYSSTVIPESEYRALSGPGLSVVSAPAPVVQRNSDLLSPVSNHLVSQTTSGYDSGSRKSSQRVVGSGGRSSSTMHVKQLELRDNHAIVLS